MGCGCKKNKPASTKAGTVLTNKKKNLTQNQQEAAVNEIIDKINKLSK